MRGDTVTYRNNGSYLRFPAANLKMETIGKAATKFRSPVKQTKQPISSPKLLTDQSFVTASQNVYDHLTE